MDDPPIAVALPVTFSGFACPRCGEPVPMNEWLTYGKCETCWTPNLVGQQVSGPRRIADGKWWKGVGVLS